MKNIKKLLAGCMALTMTFSFAACSGGSGDSSKKDDDSLSSKNNVKVPSADDVTAIPEGADNTLLFMGIEDLNPRGNQEKSTGLNIFEDKGGKIEWTRVTSATQFSKLGAAVTAGKDVPDLFNYSDLAFPCQVVQGFYQSLDDIIDFDSDMWSGIKSTADQYVLNGKHYVAPFAYQPLSLLFYDKDVITEEGLDDPIDLYDEGKWDYDAMDQLMGDYVKNASGDDERFGINGYYAPAYVQQTGETLVTTEDNITYTSNLGSAKIASAEERLANWQKNGWVKEGWIGEAREAFKNNVLFYAMAEWAAVDTHTPNKNENWGVVPFPKDPSYEGELPITSARMSDETVLWVKGSDKKDAVKTFYESYRVAEMDPKYQETQKKKWVENNPNWGEEAYDIIHDSSDPNKNLMIFDPAYGVSSLMGDDSSGFMSGVSLANWIYKSTSSADEEGQTYTWTQTIEKYSSTVEGEIKTLNESIQKFINQ